MFGRYAIPKAELRELVDGFDARLAKLSEHMLVIGRTFNHFEDGFDLVDAILEMIERGETLQPDAVPRLRQHVGILKQDAGSMAALNKMMGETVAADASVVAREKARLRR